MHILAIKPVYAHMCTTHEYMCRSWHDNYTLKDLIVQNIIGRLNVLDIIGRYNFHIIGGNSK